MKEYQSRNREGDIKTRRGEIKNILHKAGGKSVKTIMGSLDSLSV